MVSNIRISGYQKRIADLAIKNRLPSMYETDTWVEAGGLISYGADDADSFRRAAVYVDKILKGTKPADLPVEQPTKFEFVINLKTAKAAQPDDSPVGAVPSGQGDQVTAIRSQRSEVSGQKAARRLTLSPFRFALSLMGAMLLAPAFPLRRSRQLKFPG